MTPVHTIPIPSRPKRTWKQAIHGLVYLVVFIFGCVMVNGFQFAFLLPLKLLPFDWSQELYKEGIRYTKGSFGTLLVLMCQWFAPTRISLTFEQEGMGKLTEDEIKQMVIKDASGRFVSLNLPDRSIVIANHQVYADWLYAWCLTYFSNTHKDVFIVLKKSLKWVPIVGWGMQFFDFIFLARSWAADRLHLAAHLASLGRQAEQENKPLTLLIYPEGTLVSKDTRPISKKFADKMGVDDTQHCLLPRSTGLHYSLRALAPKVPNLKLIDVTVIYPGIPPMGYGQSYYTLRSIFMDRIPPPVIHMHLRLFDISQVPVGDMSESNPSAIPNGAANGNGHNGHAHVVEVDIPQGEKDKFDVWLRDLWREKDRSIGRFLETGMFAESSKNKEEAVAIPLKLRKKREVVDAFCFFLPVALVGYLRS